MSVDVVVSSRDFSPKIRNTIGVLLAILLAMLIAAAGMVIYAVATGRTVTIGPVQMMTESTRPTWDMRTADPATIRTVLAASPDGATPRAITICAIGGGNVSVIWDGTPVLLSAGNCTDLNAKGRVEIHSTRGAAPGWGTYQLISSRS